MQRPLVLCVLCIIAYAVFAPHAYAKIKSSPTKSVSVPTAVSTKKVSSKALNRAVSTTSPAQSVVARVTRPYTSPPESFETLNTGARAALVNIFCQPRGGSVRPTTGSGVIIDPRGIILTNAHVAQYVLLSENPLINLSCIVRTGSPAVSTWEARVLYMPNEWVRLHAAELNAPKPTGTGEHDFALLLITNTTDNSPLPSRFPYLTPDTRDAIAFKDDTILSASYPAEFISGITAQQGLYAVSSITTIKQLITMATSSVDMLSLGGVINAQGGSSGGAVVNQWGQLVGLITTTSDGTTTATRDLHALTPAYISRDLFVQTGKSLATFLASDPLEQLKQFQSTQAGDLTQRYITLLRAGNR